MPKKKLTKAQTKKKLTTIKNALYDLMLDRLNYGTDSFYKGTFKSLNAMHTTILTRLRSLK